jgi:hypothetical protein
MDDREIIRRREIYRKFQISNTPNATSPSIKAKIDAEVNRYQPFIDSVSVSVNAFYAEPSVQNTIYNGHL